MLDAGAESEGCVRVKREIGVDHWVWSELRCAAARIVKAGGQLVGEYSFQVGGFEVFGAEHALLRAGVEVKKTGHPSHPTLTISWEQILDRKTRCEDDPLD